VKLLTHDAITQQKHICTCSFIYQSILQSNCKSELILFFQLCFLKKIKFSVIQQMYY